MKTCVWRRAAARVAVGAWVVASAAFAEMPPAASLPANPVAVGVDVPALAPAPAPRAGTGEVSMERLPNGDVRLGLVTVHRRARTLSFPAVVNQDRDVLEVLIATPDGRLHESLLRTEAEPLHVQTCLILLGLHNGPRLPDAEGRQGDIVDLDIEWRNAAGEPIREPVEEWVLDQRSGKPMKRAGWVFVGSSVVDGLFLANAEGNLVLTYSVGDTILDIPTPAGEDDTNFIANENKKHPGVGGTVRVIVTPRERAP